MYETATNKTFNNVKTIYVQNFNRKYVTITNKGLVLVRAILYGENCNAKNVV